MKESNFKTDNFYLKRNTFDYIFFKKKIWIFYNKKDQKKKMGTNRSKL